MNSRVKKNKIRSAVAITKAIWKEKENNFGFFCGIHINKNSFPCIAASKNAIS